MNPYEEAMIGNKIEDLIRKYHWISLSDNNQDINIVLDHHMLSGFRQCEAYFAESILRKYQPMQRSWSLEFGIVYHEAVELYYTEKPQNPEQLQAWLEACMRMWGKARLDEQFNEEKGYITLGGLAGFIIILCAYHEHYTKNPEKLIAIALEIPFGKALEVPVGSFNFRGFKINLFLAGRMDMLMDSGVAIGPMDHKTFAFFKGNPIDRYETNEGITGYIYATKHLVKSIAPELAVQRRLDRGWLNCASVATPKDPNDRFRRVPIFKSEFQLESWRLRQLRTAKLILDLLLSDEPPIWDASHCDNMFHKECPFKIVHRQANAPDMFTILNSKFSIGEAWDTELL